MDEQLKEMRYNTEKAGEFFTKMMAYTLGPAELKGMNEDHNITIIDVRDKEDYKNGHIPHALSIPRAELDNRLHELSKEKLYVVYCYNQQCHLGACACRLLSLNGYHCMHLDGGFKTWDKEFKFKVEK